MPRSYDEWAKLDKDIDNILIKATDKEFADDANAKPKPISKAKTSLTPENPPPDDKHMLHKKNGLLFYNDFYLTFHILY